MSKKNNIRSIRFSDEMADLIDRQIGITFTQKFENLITRCVWELPAKEKELEFINQEILRKQQQYAELDNQVHKLLTTLHRLEKPIQELETEIDSIMDEWTT